MTTERFMVDDAGTLIDMQTRDMFDIVEEVVDLLNEQHERIEDYNIALKTLQDLTDKKIKENEQLKQQLQSILELTKKIEDCTYDMKLIGDVE